MSGAQSLASTSASSHDSTRWGLSSDRAEAAVPRSAAAERLYWKQYFADDNLTGCVVSRTLQLQLTCGLRGEVHVLQKEGQQLEKTLRKAFPNDTRTTWTIESLREAVDASRKTWAAKERLGKGKPQALFHGLMQKFDTHSHLFEVIPQGDLYTSLVTGGAMIIVKVSILGRLQHRPIDHVKGVRQSQQDH
jgi:hypothetical protein